MGTHADELTMDDLTPILFGHAAFQYLNAGCELGLFGLLEQKPGLTRDEIQTELGLEERAIDILLLGTTSLRLTRQSDGRYENAPVITRLHKDETWDMFESVVAFENPDLERVFYRYMRSWSEIANRHLAEKAGISSIQRMIDVGGGDGVNAIALARAFPQLRITVLETPGTGPIARRTIENAGLSDRIGMRECDMFRGEFPAGHDCVLFSHQLVIWKPEENSRLLARAYDALPPWRQGHHLQLDVRRRR